MKQNRAKLRDKLWTLIPSGIHEYSNMIDKLIDIADEDKLLNLVKSMELEPFKRGGGPYLDRDNDEDYDEHEVLGI